MKRFFIAAAVLAVMLVAVSVNVLPVRCSDCGGIILRTDVCSALFGGHGSLTDGCIVNRPAPMGQTSPGIAAGSPAKATQAEATAESQI